MAEIECGTSWQGTGEENRAYVVKVLNEATDEVGLYDRGLPCLPRELFAPRFRFITCLNVSERAGARAHAFARSWATTISSSSLTKSLSLAALLNSTYATVVSLAPLIPALSCT